MEPENAAPYYLAMEPDDINTYANQTGNVITICHSLGKTTSPGVFFHSKVLDFAYPLLLFQMALATAVILSLSRILKLFGLPLYVSQFLGGLLLGPSLLGQIFKNYLDIVFPLKGFILLDVLASFAYMFHFFIIGVQIDPWIIKKINKHTFSIGFFTVTLPMVVSTGCAVFLGSFLTEAEAKSLPVVALVESVLSFPMIAFFLAELGILNSEFGGVALCSSVISTLCSFCVTTISVLVHQSAGEILNSLGTVCSAILFAVAIFVTRPALMWMIRRNPDGQPLKENYIIVLLLCVCVTGICSHAMGLHIHYGPLILGIILPAGPPVGTTVMERLYPITTWMFMPIFFVKTGLVINVFNIKMKNYLLVQSIALVGAIGKFMGAFLVSLLCELPVRDAICLGLVMNFQGVVELGLFKLMKKTKAIDNESFTVLCVFMVLVTSGVTPIIRALYDPTRRYVVCKKRTVMHSKLETELRALVCIHDQESVPATINILEALNPTKQSPLSVYMLHLVELAGRANPLLIHHNLTKCNSSSDVCASDRIVKAFGYFEQNSQGLVAVFPFTAISPIKTMHEDLLSIAFHRKTSLVIVPFYKSFSADGGVESAKNSIKITNQNVLDKAPCSVAILVDRGLLKMPRFISESWCEYRVAVLFLGGSDDHEALAIGGRMAGHPSVHLTVIRLLENCNDARKTRLDNKVMNMFRSSMENNYRVTYMEEMVMDGTGTVSVIRSLESQYELIMVGRNHDKQSPLVSGLTVWDEQMELGAVGDVLASVDFMGSTTILVVQQHNNVYTENQMKHMGYFSNQNQEEEDEEVDMTIHRIL
ncbi:hypothetical protein Q3G72_010781 [Acer saccharum]|nr:hypothetical protein Q3G72_010781 [Acer saccharum]